jgi:hypothetical protein
MASFGSLFRRGEAESVNQGLIDLPHGFGRKPSETTDDLLTRDGGQRLAINNTVQPEPGFTPLLGIFGNTDLAREGCVS